jgi:hypothetical protein
MCFGSETIAFSAGVGAAAAATDLLFFALGAATGASAVAVVAVTAGSPAIDAIDADFRAGGDTFTSRPWHSTQTK